MRDLRKLHEACTIYLADYKRDIQAAMLERFVEELKGYPLDERRRENIIAWAEEWIKTLEEKKGT